MATKDKWSHLSPDSRWIETTLLLLILLVSWEGSFSTITLGLKLPLIGFGARNHNLLLCWCIVPNVGIFAEPNKGLFIDFLYFCNSTDCFAHWTVHQRGKRSRNSFHNSSMDRKQREVLAVWTYEELEGLRTKKSYPNRSASAMRKLWIRTCYLSKLIVILNYPRLWSIGWLFQIPHRKGRKSRIQTYYSDFRPWCHDKGHVGLSV